jgi:hypothetical protein
MDYDMNSSKMLKICGNGRVYRNFYSHEEPWKLLYEQEV